MTGSDFTQQPEVQAALAELHRWQRSGGTVSDLTDEHGCQYVDLVLEGGGVLGIALLGFTYGLEEAGIRFRHIGGTSAGAITALLLASCDDPDCAKSEQLAAVLADARFSDFMDGGRDARKLFELAFERTGWRSRVAFGFSNALSVVRGARALAKHKGLHPGDAFEQWLGGVLAGYGIRTLADLRQRFPPEPGAAFEPPLTLRPRPGRDDDRHIDAPRLALIAAEITTETKVTFPEMAPLFYANPAGVPPAAFARASMSVPGFFYPMRVEGVPQGAEADQRWKRLAGYTGVHFDTAYFMDGGIVSNFPIHAFHRRTGPGSPIRRYPHAPTFGVKLGSKARESYNPHTELDTLGGMAAAMFGTATHALDYDFVTRNPEYKQLVSFVDTGDHFWLDFDLSPGAKRDLFARGVTGARNFLLGWTDASGKTRPAFDWQGYLDARGRTLDR
jgi:NTE family protein